MNRYVNLMSAPARTREIRRTRIRQWTIGLLVAGGFMIPPTLVAWWPGYRQGQRLAALESQYEPIRQLIAENKTFRQRIGAIREQDRLALALTTKTPVVTLLGMIGNAVANVDQQVYIEQIGFQQDNRPFNDSNDSPASVVLTGIGVDRSAAARLADSLRGTLPFATIKLTSSGEIAVNGQTRHSFTMTGSF